MICRVVGRWLMAVLALGMLWTTPARADSTDVAELAKAAAGSNAEKQLEAIDQLTDLGSQAKAAVPQLTQALGASDPKVRWHAARALGAVGPDAASAVSALGGALDDKDAHVRSHAAHALGRIGAPSKKFVPQLVNLIADPHASVRREAIEAIGIIAPNDETVVSKLAEALSASEPPVALAAIKSLVVHGDKALPAAIEVLRKAPPKSKARYWACVLIGEYGPAAKDAAAPLANVLKTDEDPSIRLQAALALANIGPAAEPALPTLIAATEDKFEAVQYGAVYALGSIGSKEALPALDKAAGSNDSLVKTLAIWAIAKSNPDDKQAMTRAIDALIAAMEDKRPEVRQAAARALWDLKPPQDQLAPAMSRALNDDDPEIVGHVIDSLASLGSKIAPRVSDALGDEKKRPKALAIVERMGPEAKACVPALLKLLGEKDEELRVHVLRALGSVGPGASDAVGDISKALNDPSDRVASAASIALGRIGEAARSATPAIEKQLKSESSYTRAAGAWALARIDSDHAAVAKKVLPILRESLSSPVELIRTEAANTLGNLGSAARPAVADLKKAAADTSPGVSSAATAALLKIEKNDK